MSESKEESKEVRKKKIIIVSSIFGIFILIGCLAAVCYFAGLFDSYEYGEEKDRKKVEVSKLSSRSFNKSHVYEKDTERFFLPHDKKLQPLALIDAKQFCAMNGHKMLPVTVSIKDEQQLIEDVKIFHSLAQCDDYIIGYRLNQDIRYSSLDSKKQWPPLKEHNGASLVTNDRDCVRLQLSAPGQNFAIVDFKPCKDIVDYHCVIGYKTNQISCRGGTQCFRIIYAEGYDPEDMFKNYKKNLGAFTRQQNGLLLIDKEQLPLMYSDVFFSEPKICWALDVKYELDYLDVYENGPSPYKLNVVIQDPEDGCVVITKSFQLESKPCNEGGCPLCLM